MRAVLPPIGRALRPTFSFIYDLFFGWLDRRQARKNEADFAQEIAKTFPYLFSDYRGKVVPNQGVRFPLGFDYAYVTVSISPLLLRFLRGRGEFMLEAGSEFGPEHFVKCSLLVRSITDTNAEDFAFIDDAARLLRPHMEALKNAMTEERFEQTLNSAIALGNADAQKHLLELRAKGAQAELWTHK